MKVKIHRGLHQIGGCITEITTASSRVFIDMGKNLPGCGKPTTEADDAAMVAKLFANNKREHEAVFYTHIHEDHIGLFHHVPASIPQYLGEGAKGLFKIKHELLLQGESLNAEETGIVNEEKTAILKGKIALIDRMQTWSRPETKRVATSIVIGDIRITPFFCSHSVYDAYMFLIEADGKRIWHTGDYRDHGYLGKGLLPVLKTYAKEIDLLITEGTMLGRAEEEVATEKEVSKRIASQLGQYKYVFILSSATDRERYISINRAVLSHKRELFVSGLFLQEAIEYMNEREATDDRKGWKPQLLNENNIRNNIEHGFCVLCSAGHHKRVQEWYKLLNEEETLLVYSTWDGYYKDPEQIKLNSSYQVFRNIFRNCIDIHTTGHASIQTIEKSIKVVNPKTGVLCIHKDAHSSLSPCNIGTTNVLNHDTIDL